MDKFIKRAIVIDDDITMSQDQKNRKLAQLMTEMERVYRIPIFKNRDWEEKNRKIVQVYREISNMRKL
jgi:hypothetical protein